MTIKQLAKKLCAKEGKRKQVSIAQMSEIISVLSDLIYKQFEKAHIEIDWCGPKKAKFITDLLALNGAKRARKVSRKLK